MGNANASPATTSADAISPPTASATSQRFSTAWAYGPDGLIHCYADDDDTRDTSVKTLRGNDIFSVASAVTDVEAELAGAAQVELKTETDSGTKKEEEEDEKNWKMVGKEMEKEMGSEGSKKIHMATPTLTWLELGVILKAEVARRATLPSTPSASDPNSQEAVARRNAIVAASVAATGASANCGMVAARAFSRAPFVTALPHEIDDDFVEAANGASYRGSSTDSNSWMRKEVVDVSSSMQSVPPSMKSALPRYNGHENLVGSTPGAQGSRKQQTRSGKPAPASNAPEIPPAPKISLSVPPPPSNNKLSDRSRTVTWGFEWARTRASTVFVAGSFNGWGEPVRMDVSDDGKRHVAYMDLPFGRYSYKFIVDGNWWFDVLEPTAEDGDSNVNNVLEI